MRKKIHGAALIGLLVLFLLSCIVSIPRQSTPTPSKIRAHSTFCYEPTQTTITTPTVAFIPPPTTTSAPTATPRNRALDASAYKLAALTADQMDEFIKHFESITLLYMDEHSVDFDINEGALYRSIWYAAWDALMQYPDDPRAEDWFWKKVYYMSLAGEGDEATELYRQKMHAALTWDKIAPEDLPTWFKSGEFVSGYLAPNYTLELDPLEVPGYDSGHIVNLGKLHNINTPGGSCYLIVEKDDVFSTYTIHSGFPPFYYFFMMRNPLSCYAQDVTDDGIDEIIVDQYYGGHVGGTTINVYDTHSMPPKLMPFGPQQSAELTAWNGYLHNFPEYQGKTQIQFDHPFGTCEVDGITYYQWNGAWFEVSKGSIEVFQSPRTDYGLLNCHDRIIRFSEGLDPQDGILIMDQTLRAYTPFAKDSVEVLDALKIMKGLFAAYSGDEVSARSAFAEAVNAPNKPGGVLVEPASKFLDAYQEPDDLYRACSLLTACVDYFAVFIGGPDAPTCITFPLCNYELALSSLASIAPADTPPSQVVAYLKSNGVNIPNWGWYDFDGDDQAEVWFTVRHPNRVIPELWVAGQYPQGIKTMLVDELTSTDVHFKHITEETGKTLTGYEHGKTIEMVRHPDTKEPFIVVREPVVTEPVDGKSSRFKELRKMLYEGNDPVLIYNQLAAMDTQYTRCPFTVRYWDEMSATPPPGWREYDAYDCATFYYTVAFAAELAGQEREAVRRYHAVWAQFPDSPFAILAQHKLVDK
jgi:hypothetical protein